LAIFRLKRCKRGSRAGGGGIDFATALLLYG